jgi:flagellar hook-length control protein FliK
MYGSAPLAAIRVDTALQVAATTPLAAIRAIADPAARDFIASLADRSSVAALVLSRIAGGGTVEINGQQVKVAASLPQAGSLIKLAFANPDSASEAVSSESAEAPATATATALLARGSSSQPSSQTLPGGNSSALVKLGSEALNLGRLAQAPSSPLTLGGVAADIQQPAAWAEAFATLLRDSGAFYEAHLAAWTLASYPLAQVQQEPQAQYQSQAATAAGTANAAAPATPMPAHLQPAPAGSPPQSSANQSLGAAVSQASSAAAGVPVELAPLVREQLHTLETGALPFTVDAWPGQRAEMTIAAADEDGRNAGESGTPAAWKTRLKLSLPQLGSVATTLTLRGDQLWLDIEAPDEAAAQTLDGATPALTNAMAAAGVTLAATRVRHEPS